MSLNTSSSSDEGPLSSHLDSLKISEESITEQPTDRRPAGAVAPAVVPAGVPAVAVAPAAPAGPIVMQPGCAGGVPVAPVVPVGIPPGLEYLAAVNKIMVDQMVEMIEVLTGIECRNKYKICNALGQQVYFAAENSACCNRYIAQTDRAFVMTIVDNVGREVARVIAPEPLKLICQGRVAEIGTVKQTSGCIGTDYHVLDHANNPIFYIKAPCLKCGHVEFPVTTLNGGAKIGAISKFQGNLLKELFTSADTFGVEFPLDLDVRMKMTLIAATFLIDFMYFEGKDKKDKKFGFV